MGMLLLVAALLHPNASPQPRDLGAFYFDAGDQSQVWVDLDPRPLETGPSPVRLNVTIGFKGRRLTGTPKTATLRASASSWVAPLRVRMAILQFKLADGSIIDLTTADRVFQFTASCEKCSADTLVTDVPFRDLEIIARLAVVSVNALGFDVELVPADMAALRKLVDAVVDGATLSDH
jgi:hypothetical protein